MFLENNQNYCRIKKLISKTDIFDKLLKLSFS